MLMPIHTARRQRATRAVESSSAMDISLTYWVPRFWAAKDSDFITGQTVAVDGGSINTWQVATTPIARNTKSPQASPKGMRSARSQIPEEAAPPTRCSALTVCATPESWNCVR